MINHDSSQPMTPPKRPNFRPDSVISSIPSTTSTCSNLNQYPAGLIKVYQSDEDGSNDSFSITSKKLNDAKSIISQMEPIKLQGSNNTSSWSENNLNEISFETTTIVEDNSYLIDLWSKISDVERDHLVIPNDEKERIKYNLDKVVESFRSSKGTFLTSDIFLNQKIYQQEETISNGSVKINIIQEITSLLKKFEGDHHDVSKFHALEPTLAYYSKLMDAFDVLQVENMTDDGSSETQSLASSMNNSLKIYKTISKDSTTNKLLLQQPSISQTDSHDSDKPKKRNSALLGKFRGKMKNKKRVSVNWEPQTQLQSPPKESLRPRSFQQHSRSVSVSSTQTQGSSRSAKDQASIYGYLEAIENLQITWNVVYGQNISPQSEIYEKLTLVVHFLTQYIIKFLMSDVTSLSLKYIKKRVKDLV